MTNHCGIHAERTPWIMKRQKYMTLEDETFPRLEGVQYATGEEQRVIINSSIKKKADGPTWKQCSVVDVSAGESQVWCCKEQYCIGTWNIRSVNQSKLNVIKQEMARVNIGIIEISELKWTRMDEINSDDHYIYYCGQKPLRRNGVALIVNKRIWNAVLGWNFQNDRMIVHFQGKPFNISVIQIYAPTTNAEEAETDWF